MDISKFIILTIIVFLATHLFTNASAAVVSTGDFNRDFYVNWAPNRVNTTVDGRERSIELNREGGSGFASKDMFLFGQYDMQIKLIHGYSAGTVVAFYLTSNQPNRDEVDFEFLGNVPGQPYILQTNVYADGYDNREQRIKLWFDPTDNFHTYSILWNIHQIVFMVDWVPVRTYRNHADKGVAYPRFQPMNIQVSIWNGESWATNGGRDKIDWSKAPFIASARNHKIDACVWKGDENVCRAGSPTNWWNLNASSSLTYKQRRLYRWVRKYYLIYDYCQDPKRFHDKLPKECFLSHY